MLDGDGQTRQRSSESFVAFGTLFLYVDASCLVPDQVRNEHAQRAGLDQAGDNVRAHHPSPLSD